MRKICFAKLGDQIAKHGDQIEHGIKSDNANSQGQSQHYNTSLCVLTNVCSDPAKSRGLTVLEMNPGKRQGDSDGSVCSPPSFLWLKTRQLVIL